MSEELGSEAEIGRLLWVVEGFFELSGRNYHEVAFIYEFQPLDPAILERAWTRNITDGGISVKFRWFALKDLEHVNLQPAFLKEALTDPPTDTTHLVRRETRAS